MILSPQTIRKLKIMSPCHEKSQRHGLSYGLSCAGYDLTIKSDTETVLLQGDYILAVANEHFTMPNNVVGIVHDKSTWARRGLTVQNTVVEPSWRGYLTLELCNHSNEIIHILPDSPIAQVVFHYLDEPTEQPYTGKYQDQPAIPVAAKEHKPNKSPWIALGIEIPPMPMDTLLNIKQSFKGLDNSITEVYTHGLMYGDIDWVHVTEYQLAE